MLVVSGIASYGVGRVCEKVFEPKRKKKNFLSMKPIEQRNVFGSGTRPERRTDH